MRNLTCHQRTLATTPYAFYLYRQASQWVPRYPSQTRDYTGGWNLSTRRTFSQIHSLGDAEQVIPTQTGNEATQEYSFSVKPKEHKPKPKPTSQIRQSLRAWNVQHKRRQREETPSEIPHSGRVTRLPDALYVSKEPEYHTEDDKVEGEIIDDRNAEAEANDEEQYLHQGGRPLSPGTLITYGSRNVPRSDVVYLGVIGAQSLFLLKNGTWAAETTHVKRQAISVNNGYPIPNFLTLEEINAVSAHLPKEDVTRVVEAGASPALMSSSGYLPDALSSTLMPKFRAFDDAQRRFFRDHKTKLDRMYDDLALEDKWRVLDIKDLPSLVLGVEFAEMTDFAKGSFVRHTLKCHPLIVPAQSAATVTCYIGPKQHHEKVKQVQQWARLYQEAAAQASAGKNVSEQLRNNPLSSFIDKARRMILRSRKIRRPTSLGSLGPASDRRLNDPIQKLPCEETLSSDDEKIVTYLWDMAFRRPASRYSLAHAALIVRAVGAYPNMDLDIDTYKLLLQEIGCADPWAALERFTVPLPGARASAELTELHDKAFASVPLANENNLSTLFPDSLAHMRKDWGDMEVLCVDRSSTSNIEDGISVEPADELPGAHWVHIHLAHPTAHLEVTHPVVQYARKRGVAYYTKDERDQNFSMLPRELINHFSLRSGSPVLTISTLLTSDGCVHDVAVVPGVIRNVHRVDRDRLHASMGIPEEPEECVLVVGKVTRSRLRKLEDVSDGRHGSDLISRHLPKYGQLRDVLMARRKRRTQEVETPANYRQLRIKSTTYYRLPEVYRPGRELELYHWNSDPGIIVKGSRRVDVDRRVSDNRTEDIIAQAMRLASESLGKWLSDRQIPAIFMGNEAPEGASLSQINATGRHTIPTKMLYTRMSHAVPFSDLNMKQYASCTSPCRRFIDMLTLFQVDSYLKAQAQGLLQEDMIVKDEGLLTFSRHDIDTYLDHDASRADSVHLVSEDQKQFYTLQALFRAFHFKESLLPDTMEILVESPTSRDMSGVLQPALGNLIPWDVPAFVEESPEGYEKTARYNDFLPTKIVSVDLARRRVNVRAVGPPTIDPKLLDPIEAYTMDNFDDGLYPQQAQANQG